MLCKTKNTCSSRKKIIAALTNAAITEVAGANQKHTWWTSTATIGSHTAGLDE